MSECGFVAEPVGVVPDGHEQGGGRLRSEGIDVGGARRSLAGELLELRPDPTATRAPDLLDRNFTADRPNALWVTDITYVPTWAGMAYVCFIVDVLSRTIVGWRVASNMRTDMVLDAVDMGCFQRGARHSTLVFYSDAGSQFTSIPYTERLAEIGASPSIGTVADSFDNALAETVNGLYKTELIHRRSPWRTVDDVELATLGWVQSAQAHRTTPTNTWMAVPGRRVATRQC